MAAPATPQRPIPGNWQPTPAPAPSIFAQHAQALRQQQEPVQNPAVRNTPTTSPVERAARAINDTLASEARFPELEAYVGQGISGDYDIPKNPAWNPYQPLKWHDLPPRILEQANLGTVAMKLGMFAAIGHAWAAVDNCLYLWDYTMPNPDLIGFEENRYAIETVKLVVPRPGVFVKEVTNLIVVSTTAEMLLLGVAPTKTETGAKTIALYNTKMSIPVKGLGVRCIEASSKTGRIFFSGSSSDDLYEFQYQQEEGWFRGKTHRICHTQQGMLLIDSSSIKAITQYLGPSSKPTTYKQLAIDDSRNFLYTLSDRSEIKVWLIRESVTCALTRPYTSLLQNTSHFNANTALLTGQSVGLVSINAIPSTEAAKLGLMATTNTGCRLYLSLTRGYGYQADVQNGPTSMQVLHIRYPPSDPNAPPPAQQPQQSGGNPSYPLPPQPGASSAYNQPGASNSGGVDTTSQYLSNTHDSYRFPPGYFLDFKPDDDNVGRDKVFCTVPDFARLKMPNTTNQVRFQEFGQWLQLNGLVEQVEVLSGFSGATSGPFGFGNEMAVQFEGTNTEIGILTANGIQTIRRRRLVDIFASLMRHASTDTDGLEGDIKRFVRVYGREETTATALAVACGKGVEVMPDSRVSAVTEPDILERARLTFIEHGGKPEFNANALVDGASPAENVRPSPRHEGLALYTSRLVRSIWRSPVIKETLLPGSPPIIASTAGIEKLRQIQFDLTELHRFLSDNSAHIEGLAGPQSLGRIQSRQEELAAQGEHRAMKSQMQLISSMIEGISFVLVLFDERLEEIMLALPEDSRRKVRELTYEALFVMPAGRELGKELVKAIVNRNIASGSNVETVADALRRRCGSFCSADDVMVFKAQEQVKRALQAGSQTESGRTLLNQSLQLFQRVAGSLTIGDDSNLKWAVQNYIEMQFFAGAIQLCLTVADAKDKAGRAASYVRDDKPEGDPREAAFNTRQQCYGYIFVTIEHLDVATQAAPTNMDGQYSLAEKRSNEAYDIVNSSDDYVFQTSLYDWYLQTHKENRLLEATSPYVVRYLQQAASEWNLKAAELLCKYYVHNNDYLEAAAAQLALANGKFSLTLAERINHLSRARTNASTRQSALLDSRHSKQQILSQIDDLLQLAAIQETLLNQMRADPRLSDERAREVLPQLEGEILSIDELFNAYASPAGYHDVCIMCYYVADHRNAADILSSWQELINQAAREARLADQGPWEIVSAKVMQLGKQLQGNDAIFSPQFLLPMLERFALEVGATGTGPVDTLLAADVPHETLLPVLEGVYYGNEAPFVGSQRRIIANHMVYVIQVWLNDSVNNGERMPFGNEESASLCGDILRGLLSARDALVGESRVVAEGLTEDIRRLMR